MRLFNETPFAVNCRNGILQPRQPFLTVVVKGTFALRPGSACEPLPAEDQAKPGPPVAFMDEHGNSLKTENDMVPFKQRADCVFIGSAHAPGGVPVESLTVTFGVGTMRKRLVVHGDRAWAREAGGSVRLDGPEPFVEMPIRNEFAHGGPRSTCNRHGIGFGQLDSAPGSTLPVANIMPVGHAAQRWDVEEEPAGFGVLGHDVLPRRRRAGTFDDRWLFRRRPLPPTDFDPAFFNAARADQQIEGYLTGDEEIHLENLHPTEPVFEARLPGLAVRCFVNRCLDRARPDQLEFSEIATVLDTCVVDMGEGTLTLLWRGTLETISKRHERIRHMLVAAEPVATPLPREHYAARMQAHVDRTRPPRGSTELSDETRQELVELNRRGLEQMLGTLREGGAPKALIDEVEKQETVEDAMRVLTKHVEDLSAALQKPPAE